MFVYCNEHSGVYAYNLSTWGSEVEGLLYIPRPAWARLCLNKTELRKKIQYFFCLTAYNEYAIFGIVNCKRSGCKMNMEYAYFIAWLFE